MHANALRMQLRLRVHIHHPQPPPCLLLPVRRHALAMRMHLLITFHLLPTLAHLPARAPPPAFTYALLLLTAIPQEISQALHAGLQEAIFAFSCLPEEHALIDGVVYKLNDSAPRPLNQVFFLDQDTSFPDARD
jgi:hypothetical protein